MTKQPLLNAIAAIAYIVAVATFMFYATASMPGPDTVLAPIALISLFTLSAGVMGYIFLSQPVQLYLDGAKKEAVTLFVQTLTIFGSLTLVVLAIFFISAQF